MIIAEKEKIRTPIENMLLKEMMWEDLAFVARECSEDYAVDMNTDRGMIANVVSSDEDLDAFLDDLDIPDDDSIF